MKKFLVFSILAAFVTGPAFAVEGQDQDKDGKCKKIVAQMREKQEARSDKDAAKPTDAKKAD